MSTAAALVALVPQLLAFLGGLAGLGALARVRAERRKINSEADKSGADAAKVLSDAAVALLDPTREQVAYLQAQLISAHTEITKLREETGDLRQKMSVLDDQLRDANRELAVLRSSRSTWLNGGV
jgi:chromosome segregation ATPase